MQNERTISIDILSEILDKKAYNNIALSLEMKKHKNLHPRDRAFITELTNGVLRNIILIDYIISKFSKTPIKKLKPLILNILRQSVYQIYFMETKSYAVCSEAVEIAKSRGLQGLSGFVNGVLRTIIREKDNVEFPNEKTDGAKYLSIFYSHPLWMVEKWLKNYDYDFVKRMCKKNNEPPSVTICTNTIKTTVGKLVSELNGEGVETFTSDYCAPALRLKGSGSIGELNSYKKGFFHVQDIASQIAVTVLSPKCGDLVVDLCAAPGGKSFLAAYLMENKGMILARDIYTHKIKLLTEGAERLGINIIKAEKLDALTVDDNLIGQVDCVIVDAPCSGLGLIRRKPDIKMNRDEKDILELQKIQRDILNIGAKYVKKGGYLLYSTCTITEEENMDNVRWFLDNYDFAAADIKPFINIELHDSINENCLNLFPHMHDSDGFFISKFKRRG